MKLELVIHTQSSESRVVIGESYRNLSEYLPDGKKVILVTDTHLPEQYGTFIRTYPFIETEVGEEHKTLDTVKYIYQRLLELEADRNNFIVAFGGGIVCDMTGFAASTYMRGIPFGFVSTTLLSQVDASVGGKNGVNMFGLKNMVGTFNQPRFVLCDVDMTATLPEREYISGFAEIVKAAVIRDAGLFEYLEKHYDKAIAHDRETMFHLVAGSVKIKAAVVERDEREQGERKILNFGHTFGHAIELQTKASHGEAVSIGMMIAVRWSVCECGLPGEKAERIEQLLKKLGLPVTTTLSPEEIFHVLVRDKKREDDFIHLVLLTDIGKTEIRKTPLNKIRELLPRYI